MKITTAPLLTAMGVLALGCVTVNAQFGSIMLEDWNSAPLGDLQNSGYTGNWSDVGFHSVWPDGHSSIAPVNSVAEIRTDDSNSFGRGTSNQFLALEEAAGFSLTANMPAGHEVATLSYDMVVTGFMPSDHDATDRFTSRFFTDDGTAINHGLQNTSDTDYRVRNEDPDRFDVGTFYHFDVVTNNSVDSIAYNAPEGEVTLGSGMTAVWVDGNLVTTYDFGRTSGTGEFTSVVMETFSNNTWSANFDEIAVSDGAEVIPEPSTYALIFGGLAMAGALYVRRRRA